MSTIKVNKIENTATGDGGIAIDASGHVQIDGQQLPTAGALSNRNLIINGAMQVAQRGTQVTGLTGNGYQTCDRVLVVLGGLGTWTVDQDTNAPNEFSNSFKMTCTTADASPAAGDNLIIVHHIEAQNLQSLGFGTADAKATTLSFWVRSNKTGNASVDIRQPDNSNRHVSFQYSISSANTWEYKTISIPADTSGVINNDNGSGLRLDWWLNSGSTYSSGSHQATWTANVDADRNPSNLGVGGATSDYWQITGVQLEVGAKSTEFEHRSFNDELQRCLRYYEENPTTQSLFRVYPGGSSVSVAYSYIWNVEKRVAPTVTIGSKSPSGFAETIDKYGAYYFRSGSVTGYSVVGPITADAEL